MDTDPKPDGNPSPFPLIYLIDRLVPSETFIWREVEQLRRRDWHLYTWTLKGGNSPLPFSSRNCLAGLRWRFFRIASKRISSELFRNPVSALRILHRLPQAATLVGKTLQDDCQLIHAEFAGITADLAGIAAETLRIPWSCAVHAHDVFTRTPRQIWRRLRTAVRIVACSHQAARRVLEAGYPADQIDVIHHGLRLNDFCFDSFLRERTFFTACRLSPKKGIDTLLQSCRILQDRGREFSCVIAGDGPLQSQLEQLRNRLGLRETVEFIGWQSQESIRFRIQDATLLILPSRRTKDGDRDGIANILVESMALGTPVLTTTAGAAGELITDEETGFLVPPDNPEKLAERMERALLHPESLQPLIRKARQTIEDRFDGHRNVQALETFFHRCLGKAGCTARTAYSSES
ncbi:MAG: glycosyltransferase family 4 protein [Kiritimatiellae bacterium]|nr:glycosyltransferase family 4 protein [Kiritimatiellia bacterium]